MSEFTFSVKVYYEDTDAAGIVYYANYLKFMERARTEWLCMLGFEPIFLHHEYQMVFIVKQIMVDYLKPALLNDTLEISASLSKLGKVSMVLAQQIRRQQTVLCTAVVKLGCVNYQTLKPQPLPPSLKACLEQL